MPSKNDPCAQTTVVHWLSELWVMYTFAHLWAKERELDWRPLEKMIGLNHLQSRPLMFLIIHVEARLLPATSTLLLHLQQKLKARGSLFIYLFILIGG